MMDSLYQMIIILEELLAEIKELEEGVQNDGYIIEVEELIKKKIDTLKKKEIIRLEAESNMLKFKENMASTNFNYTN